MTDLIKGARPLGGDADRPAARRRVPSPRSARGVEAAGATVIDADGLVALPGLVDLHTHLREPGREDAETVETGTRAAALGGFTAVHAMANTDPVADTAGVVEQVWRLGREAGYCDVQPVGAVTVGLRRRAARRARRDGRLGRAGPGLLRRRQVRLRRGADAARAGVRQGVRRRHRPARAGAAADRGRPDERGRAVRRCSACAAGRRSPRRRSSPATCLLAAHVGSRLHVCHVSTAGSVEIIRWAKAQGLDVTAEVTPHHLLLTDELAATYDPVYKVNPPLRTEADVEALREALADGTIDCVATDHAPHPVEDKDCEWAAAAFGMLGLETALVGRAGGDGRRPGCSTGPGSPTGCRCARRASAGSTGTAGRSRRASRRTSCWSTRPPASTVDPMRLASQAATRRIAGPRAAGRVVATFLRGRATVLDGDSRDLRTGDRLARSDRRSPCSRSRRCCCCAG